tara:strand:- start:4971 stop:5264 length:294 start_codon:yes stop_codon:yes gene_type:complete
VNNTTGEQWEEMMSIAQRESYLESNPNIRTLITQVNIVAGRGGIKTDGGFQERLSQIGEQHPNSALGSQYGSKSIKDVKTRHAVEKWRKKRSADPNK